MELGMVILCGLISFITASALDRRAERQAVLKGMKELKEAFNHVKV